MTDNQVTYVSVRKFPKRILQRLKKAAAENGIKDSDGSAVKWAAVQFAKTLPKESKR